MPWGAATIDWCEDNYVHSSLIAETANTLSNIGYIALALFGLWQLASSSSMPPRYALQFLGMLVVGIGSTLFHATLRFHFQLLDELPMLACSAVFVYCMSVTTWPTLNRRLLATALSVLTVALCAVYLATNKPTFHEVAYGVLVTMTILLSAYQAYAAPRRLRRETARVKKLFWFALLTYLFGFASWLADNHLCSVWKQLRGESALLGLLLQPHSYWHLTSSVGTYAYICFSIVVGENVAFDYKATLGLPRLLLIK